MKDSRGNHLLGRAAPAPFLHEKRYEEAFPRPRAPWPRPDLPLLLQLADRFIGGLVTTYSRLFQGTAKEAAAPAEPGFSPLGGGADSVASLKRTLAIQPHNCLAWFQLGMVHLQQESPAEAVEAFEQARRFGFDTFDLHFYLAEALAGLERHEEAVAELYRALEKQPEAAEPAYRLGLSLSEIDRFEEAAAAFRIAISRAPHAVRYYQSLGLTLEELGQRDEAIKCFKQAMSLERRHTP